MNINCFEGVTSAQSFSIIEIITELIENVNAHFAQRMALIWDPAAAADTFVTKYGPKVGVTLS